MLNQVKNLLGVELSDIKLAELKLENGTVLEAESFEAGKEVFILTEDEKVALPVGEYELEDSRVLVVQEEGVIQEIKAQEEEEEVIEDDSEEVEAEYISREEFTKEIDEIKAMIEKLGNKEDMSSQVAEQVSLAVTEVLNEEAKEEEILAEELSKPAANPIKHSPEEDKFEAKFKFAQNRKKSTLDRVMETIVNK